MRDIVAIEEKSPLIVCVCRHARLVQLNKSSLPACAENGDIPCISGLSTQFIRVRQRFNSVLINILDLNLLLFNYR